MFYLKPALKKLPLAAVNFIIAVIFFFVCCPGQAFSAGQQQEAAGQKQSSSDNPGNKEPKTLFSYKKELNLTDRQEADIKKLLFDLQNLLIEKTKEISVLRHDLTRLVKEKGDLRVIRKKIEAIAMIQADNTYRNIEISRKIEDILTPEQLKKWQDIQKREREKARTQAQPAGKK